MWKLNWLDHVECISIRWWTFSQVLPLDLLLWLCWKVLMLENSLCLCSLGFSLINVGNRDSNCPVKQHHSFLISRLLLFTALYSLSLSLFISLFHTNTLYCHCTDHKLHQFPCLQLSRETLVHSNPCFKSMWYRNSSLSSWQVR